MKKMIMGMLMIVAIMTVSGCETKPKANGTLKGVVLCYHNFIGTRPDVGAEVYAFRIPKGVSNTGRISNVGRSPKTKIDIDLGKKTVFNSNEIKDCIETYIDYKLANALRGVMSSGIKIEGFMGTLKMLGADTEGGWEEIRSKGQEVLNAMKIGQIPSNKTTVCTDGTFTLDLLAGTYFILITSKMRSPEDTYEVVTISNGMTTNISYEFR